MSFWEQAVEATNHTTTEDEFEAVAYRLVAEQVLYDADRSSRVAYSLLRDFEKTFQRALEPLGLRVRVNTNLRYACAIPRHAKAATASLEPTLLALVLRRIYDQEARAGRQDDAGEVSVDLESLSTHYRQATNGREMPGVGPLRALLKTLQRWGIARTVDDDSLTPIPGAPQPFVVVIRPGIMDVLGETALERLAQHSAAASREGASAAVEDELEEPARDDDTIPSSEEDLA